MDAHHAKVPFPARSASPPADSARLASYADVVVQAALNLQPEQRLSITASIEHREIVRAVARAAFGSGAAYVDVRYVDRWIEREHLLHGPEQTLSYTPPERLRWIEGLEQDNAAYLQLHGEPDATLFSDIDPRRVGKSRPVDLYRVYLDAVRSEVFAWAIVGAPNEGWAERVYGDPNVDRLWDAVAYAMRLDEPDPVAAWRERIAELDRRAHCLSERRFDALHFVGPGTDVTLGLHQGGRWLTTSTRTRHGQLHASNLPSEEVYTSPDWRRVEGVVTSTRPLVIGGTTVRDLRMRFEAGRVVDLHATTGAEVVETELDSDERARYIGEVALVDRASRIGQLGTTFLETLFDENATSHIAYGAGFPRAVPSLADVPPEDQLARGINNAGIHRDFMIGGPAVAVDGVTTEGDHIPILRDDEWQLPE